MTVHSSMRPSNSGSGFPRFGGIKVACKGIRKPFPKVSGHQCRLQGHQDPKTSGILGMPGWGNLVFLKLKKEQELKAKERRKVIDQRCGEGKKTDGLGESM